MRFFNLQSADQKLIDLVPIVNIVLLLTFFFLLSWSFVLQPGVEVRLPTTNLSTTYPQSRHMITLKKSVAGKEEILLYFDENSVDRETLVADLKTASQKNPGEWITLNADETISYSQVYHVAELVIQFGLRPALGNQPAISLSDRKTL